MLLADHRHQTHIEPRLKVGVARLQNEVCTKDFFRSRAAKRGCFKRGGVPDLDLSFLFVLFCPFGTFPGIFPICPGTLRGFSRFVLFLFLGLLRAPTRNSPERVRDTIWTFPKKSGKHPGLETPRFSFSQFELRNFSRKMLRNIP